MGLPYAMTTILAEAKLALVRVEEDLDALSPLGVTRGWLEHYRREIQTAERLPDKETRQRWLNERTEQKNRALAACYHWADTLQERIRFLYGVASSEYQRFPSREMDEAHNSEQKMFPLVKTLIEYARELADKEDGGEAFSAYAEEGQAMLRALRAADQAQEHQKEDNLAAGRERVELFRTLYHKINRINRAGRTAFRDDPVKKTRYRSPWYRYH